VIKRKNQRAWWLAAVLAAMVLGATGVLFANSQCRLPEAERFFTLLPTNEWGLGELPIEGAELETNSAGVSVIPVRQKLGFFTVRIKHALHESASGPVSSFRARP
jgi:hypothetical protein